MTDHTHATPSDPGQFHELGGLVARAVLAAGAGDRDTLDRIVGEAADAGLSERLVAHLAAAVADRVPEAGVMALASAHLDALAGDEPNTPDGGLGGDR